MTPEPDFSLLFHQSSKKHRWHRGSEDVWPKEWKTVYYKAYPRFPQIVLPKTKLEADLATVIMNRHTSRKFDSKVGLDTFTLSNLLQYSCGTTTPSGDNLKMRRAQPSGGGRYPIEVYLLVLRGGEGLPPGLYHYNVKLHTLETLWDKAFTKEELKEYFVYEWTADASVVFLMTAVFWRNQMKYGERGYRYILIEAGHIGQNLYLVAQALGLKCVALGGTRDEKVEELLDIDGVNESVVYALAIGG